MEFRDRDEFLRAFSPKMREKKQYEWRVNTMDEFDVDESIFSQITNGLKEVMVGLKN